MIHLLALGSRGDVQPMASLAHALGQGGEQVAVVALAEYEALVHELAPGARFVGLPGSLDDALSRGRVQDTLGRTLPGQFVLLKRWTSRMATPLAAALLETVQPGDTVVTGVLTRGVAMALVAGRGCRMATVVYTGQLPTLRRESFFAPQYFTGFAPYDRWGARFSWRLAAALGSSLTRTMQSRLQLPHKGFSKINDLADAHPILVAADAPLVPPAPDWPRSTHQVGYLAPPPRPFEPSPELADFLRREPAFVGFGSFTQFITSQDTRELVRAAELAHRPVITIAPPGSEPGLLSPNVLAVRGVPFEWLFGRVVATVHHGGSGTTHETLRSGRPSIAIPFGADQPYHASRLHALGLGPVTDDVTRTYAKAHVTRPDSVVLPSPLAGHHLDAERVATVIRELVDSPRHDAYTRAAQAAAGRTAGADGPQQAVAALRAAGLLTR